MEGRTFLFLSGLCFLPVCFPRRYILVEEAKTWTEAQRYCREKYTDLASVSNQQESDQLLAAAQKYDVGNVWIGLYDDIKSWRWSLEEEGYYGEGEAEFKMWGHTEPNNYGGIEHCAVMHIHGLWNDASCQTRRSFTCFKGRLIITRDDNAGTQSCVKGEYRTSWCARGGTDSSSSFHYVTERKTWEEAQSYCRKHYTDLASVRNQSENDHIKGIMKNNYTWIGLHRDSWKWSDGSPYSFTSWNPSKLSGSVCSSCVLLHRGLWHIDSCDTKLFFVCHFDPVEKHVLRVKVTLKDSPVNPEEAADAILLQFRETLKEHGLREDLKLTWRKQPDGKIFHLEKTEKKKKEEDEQFICA